MPDAAIRFDAVGLVRNDNAILTGIDWQVGRGENWAVLGMNGSGKSTLLRLAGAQLHPSSGSVEVLGERLGRVDVRKLRRRVAFSGGAITREFDRSTSLLQVAETGATAALASWWDVPTDETRDAALTLLDELGVGMIADRPFGVVSEGERQKAILARALMAQSELVLLDEPFAGLDVGARERLVKRLEAMLRNDAAPMVLVSHHLEELPSQITHVLLIRNGSIVTQGPVADVLTDQSLSDTFGLALRVTNNGGRWACTAL